MFICLFKSYVLITVFYIINDDVLAVKMAWSQVGGSNE